MRILVDTHALVWWLRDDGRLSTDAAKILENPKNEILISAAVGWELSVKVNLGKILPAALVDELEDALAKAEFVELPIGLAHAVRASLLPLHHRDPFDRVLAAQAQMLNLPILSADRVLDHYGVQRMW